MTKEEKDTREWSIEKTAAEINNLEYPYIYNREEYRQSKGVKKDEL